MAEAEGSKLSQIVRKRVEVQLPDRFQLRVPLFHRAGRGIVLSDAGSQLVEPARQVARDL